MTAELPRELPIPPGLEDRAVDTLRRAGLLRGPGQRRPSMWLRAAAGIVLFLGGAIAGAAWNAPPGEIAAGMPRFVLLLEAGPLLDSGGEARAVEQYRAWAASLMRGGRFVTGDRLAPETAAVPSGVSAGDGRIQGFFVISAESLADAVSVAKSSPHVARGGRIIVRPIDTPPPMQP